MATTLTLANAPGRAGILDLTVGTACTAAGDNVTNVAGTTFLAIYNALVGALTVTFVYGPGGTIDGATLPTKTAVIAAGKIAVFGPFTALYKDANNNLNITYSPTPTGCKINAFKSQ